MKNIFILQITFFTGILVFTNFALAQSSYENTYPLLASSSEGQVIFAATNRDRTQISFIECELSSADLQSPLLALSPKNRRCLELGTILNTEPSQERFDLLFTSYMNNQSAQAGVGLHTVSYVVSGVTGLLTAGYIGLGASLGDGAIAFKQALPFVILTVVTGAVGYSLEQSALQRARVEQSTIEYAVRQRKAQVLKNKTSTDHELMNQLQDNDLSQKIYLIFKEAISQTLTQMNMA